MSFIYVPCGSSAQLLGKNENGKKKKRERDNSAVKKDCWSVTEATSAEKRKLNKGENCQDTQTFTSRCKCFRKGSTKDFLFLPDQLGLHAHELHIHLITSSPSIFQWNLSLALDVTCLKTVQNIWWAPFSLSTATFYYLSSSIHITKGLGPSSIPVF